jgi:HD-GYP domain-containing protein (c-di-GMP phosphodiesterase class II)
MENDRQRLLLIGLHEEFKTYIGKIAGEVEVEAITSKSALEDSFIEWMDGQFRVVLVGDAISEMTPNELAQLTKTQCPTTPKYFLPRQQSALGQKDLIKNGFDGLFWLPMDEIVFKNILQERLANTSEKSYMPVQLIDIEGDTKLDFDIFVYLQLNRKHIRFSAANQIIGRERVRRLREKQVATVHIQRADMTKFYSYSSAKLNKLGQDGSGVSETERRQKLQESVRSLILNIFDHTGGPDYGAGREFMTTCQGIISTYITNGSSENWYQRILSSIGQSQDPIDHASNVSTYAALFAIALSFRSPEDLALAGLFHDLGEVQAAEPAPGPEFQKHPARAIEALKAKRVVIGSAVEAAILQHHEKYDGSGYPNKLPASKLSLEAQLLSFADRFDELTRHEPGAVRIRPSEALETIAGEGRIDPDLIYKLRNLF